MIEKSMLDSETFISITIDGTMNVYLKAEKAISRDLSDVERITFHTPVTREILDFLELRWSDIDVIIANGVTE